MFVLQNVNFFVCEILSEFFNPMGFLIVIEFQSKILVVPVTSAFYRCIYVIPIPYSEVGKY